MRKCLICEKNKTLSSFYWRKIEIYHCKYCDIDFCANMIEIEGNSSPVHMDGIKMMENSFFITNSLADSYAKKRIVIYENLLERKCENILDIGCGPGVFFDPYNSLSINWQGLEVSPFWIKFGKKNKIPIINDKIENIKRTFDVITAHQVLEHVKEPNEFINNVKNILNPGGIIHFELPNNKSFSSQFRKLSPYLSKDYGFIQPPMHMRAYSERTIDFLFKKHELQIEKIFTCSNNDSTWGQVRSYRLLQKAFYSATGFINKGSLLIGIAKKKE